MTLPCPANTGKVTSKRADKTQMASKKLRSQNTAKVGRDADSERRDAAPEWAMGQYGDDMTDKEGTRNER